MRPLWLAGALLLATACGVETIVNKVEEREANRMLELLENEGIAVTKIMVDTGREQYFNIAVPPRSRLQAIRLLNQYQLPARPERGYDTVFEQSGLIPTQSEETAKELSALEGEIEKQLRLVADILDVEVQIVLPKQDPLRTQEVQPASASVTIKYLPRANGAKPLSEPQVQAIVAAGVEKLTPDRVVVVMTASGSAAREVVGAASLDGKQPWWRNRQAQMTLAALIVLIVLAGILIVFNALRLRTVRGRLIRLQNEIAKAKKKPAETSPAPVAS